MKCRVSTPEDMGEVRHILQKGHRFSSMTHVGWKLGDSGLNPCDYTVVLEEKEMVTGTIFFETQSKQILGGALPTIAGGGGAIYPEENLSARYSAMMCYIQELAERLEYPVITFASTNEFTYSLLRKMGFHPLFYQRNYVKILNVRKMIAIAVEKLNRTGVPDSISLVIRVRPESEEPFSITIANGEFSLGEDTTDSDIEVAGNLGAVVASLTSNAHTNVIHSLLKRQVTFRVRISSVIRILHLVRFLW
ncbi:MAG: hypothetical protein HXS52_02475 [Theionarchaea archaeon]|nr:hypothetical protein [Theionarchaea archaeon]MBU7036771.1 hypothetical protein [Theionarchaea archaeon]